MNPHQEDNSMQEGFPGKSISTADLAPLTQPEQPQQPADRFAGAADSVDCALQDLSHIVSVLVGQDDSDEPQVAGRSTPSVMQIVRQYPDELDAVAKRIHREGERLRDAFLVP